MTSAPIKSEVSSFCFIAAESYKPHRRAVNAGSPADDSVTSARDPRRHDDRAGRSRPDARVRVGEERRRTGRTAKGSERGGRLRLFPRILRGEILLYPSLDTNVAGRSKGMTRPR